MDDYTIAAAAYFFMCHYNNLNKKKNKPKKRRWWMVSLHHSRARYDGTNMLADLLKEPSGQFENFCRMSLSDFNMLLDIIGPKISRKDRKWRKAIPTKIRLAVTLRFLATGDSYESLHYLFKISPQVISDFVPEVCSALIEALKDNIKVPKENQEWLAIADNFEKRWHFPHCLGVMDGKHIIFQCPFKSYSQYINYKGTFSIVLLALVDSNYCFTYADIGCQGRISDGGIFRNSTLYEKIYGANATIPQPAPIAAYKNTDLPYVFLADDAFELTTKMLKPYPGIHKKGSFQRIFNYRLSHARIIVENVFGIMASIFRVLRKPMLLQPSRATFITLTCVYLHNFLRKSKTSGPMYTPRGSFDSLSEDNKYLPGSWRNDSENITSLVPLQKIPRKLPQSAQNVRDEYANYFRATGRVDWQEKYN